MTNPAQDLRAHLCELMTAVGPDAPTLCDGWAVRDLAAHLVIRDRRPDAMPGIMIEKFAGHTQAVQDEEAARAFDEIVDRVRTGPPSLSPMRIPAVDAKANTAEYAIHAQDVRLAQPREVQEALPPLPEGAEAAIWSSLSTMGRMALRGCPAPVTAVDLDGQEVVLSSGKKPSRTTTSNGRSASTTTPGAPAPTPSRGVRLIGTPSDILMTLSGRGDAVGTRLQGAPDDIAAFEGLKLGL